MRELALQVPNPADASVPDGGEDDGEVDQGRRRRRPPRRRSITPRSPRRSGFVDTARAAEASGSRFAYIMREAALLELALVNYAMSTIVRARLRAGRSRPTLVRERTMEEAGFFPTDRAQVYDVDDGELFLVGTSEVAAVGAAPRRDAHARRSCRPATAGYSTCFRREAGTYGKDTRGIFRVHQFDKVEMFSFCEPDESRDEHERILAIEEEIIGGLGLPYRVVEHRGRRSRPGRGEEVRHRSVAAVGRSRTASSRRARTTPTTRRAGSARA